MSTQQINDVLLLDGNNMSTATMVAKINSEENLSLRELHLINFSIGTIPAIAGALERLKHNLVCLIISDVTMFSDDAYTIANLISESKLPALKLIRCGTKDGALCTIIGAINKSYLKKLDLVQLWIGKDETNAIISAMKSERSCLIKLSFTKCTFEDDGLVLILRNVKLSSVRILILKLLKLDSEETLSLTDCVSTVELIKLSLDGSIFDRDNQEVMVASMKDSSIKQLNMRCTSLFPHLNKAIDFRLNSKIEKINFYEYGFTFEEKLILAESTKQNSHIRNISLCCGYSINQNLTRVCDLLKNSSLTELNLNYCYLSGTQLRTIIDSIKGSSITSLNLDNNYLDTVGIAAICDLLEHHNLVKLNLNMVDLTDEALRAILPSLKKSSLIKLDIDHRPEISADIRREIKEILLEQQKMANRFAGTKSARNTKYHTLA